MDRLRRHKAKLAFACLTLGVISMLRAQTSLCADAGGAPVDCNAMHEQPGVRIIGGSINPRDLGLGLLLVLVAPLVLIFIRRPY